MGAGRRSVRRVISRRISARLRWMSWEDPFLLSPHPAGGPAGRSGRRGRPWRGSCGGASRDSGGPGSRPGRTPASRSGSIPRPPSGCPRCGSADPGWCRRGSRRCSRRSPRACSHCGGPAPSAGGPRGARAAPRRGPSRRSAGRGPLHRRNGVSTVRAGTRWAIWASTRTTPSSRRHSTGTGPGGTAAVRRSPGGCRPSGIWRRATGSSQTGEPTRSSPRAPSPTATVSSPIAPRSNTSYRWSGTPPTRGGWTGRSTAGGPPSPRWIRLCSPSSPRLEPTRSSAGVKHDGVTRRSRCPTTCRPSWTPWSARGK